MDGWLKALIAAACIVVIAGGGYIAWSEWNAKVMAERAAAIRVVQENAVRKRASLTPTFCNYMAKITLPPKPGDSPETTVYLADLKACDSLKRLGAYERHQLGLSGVF